MTLEEYKRRIDDDDFNPGWDCIEEAFAKVYGDKKARHFATNLKQRASLGGDQYLDGFSIYESSDFLHFVSFGMSALYANEESFGGEWSGFGYEMTFKIKSKELDECKWVFDVFANLAYSTNVAESGYLEPFQFIMGDGNPLDRSNDSRITALIVVNDTQIEGVDSIHGRLDFLQLVGITQSELIYITQNQDEGEIKERIKNLIEMMRADNPLLITDMKRDKSYV